MAIKYCDYISGNDTSEDGSASNPYKTITKASEGLTGGDEVRVAKSPDPISLSGTFNWTNYSTSVYSSAGVFSDTVSNGETDGTVRLGDFIKGPDNNWWEIVSVTDANNATLYRHYTGSSTTGASSYKLGITSTGAADSSTTAVQSVSSSGSSLTSRLKISGGWDLTTQTQTGQTYFRQMHSTFSYRYGYGLQLLSKNFIEISNLHFLRYNNGLDMTSSNGCLVTSMYCASNGGSGIYIGYGNRNILASPSCNANVYGMLLYYSNNNQILSLTSHSNSSYGLWISYSNVNKVISPSILGAETAGIYVTNLCYKNVVYKYSGSSNTADVSIGDIITGYDEPLLLIQNFGTAGDNRAYYFYGTTYRDTTYSRSSACLKFSPTSSTYYILHEFYFPVEASTDKTIYFYLRKDSSFNGDVQAGVYFLGSQLGSWNTVTPSSSNTYEQKYVSISGTDITEDGVATLVIKVRGSAGNIYLDDFSTA